MVKRKIPKVVKTHVKSYLQRLQRDGLPIERAFIFGSYAKDTQRQWSDIDICVISSSLNKKKDPLGYLWSQKNYADSLAMISPVGFTPQDFVDEDPLVWEIKRTGIQVL